MKLDAIHRSLQERFGDPLVPAGETLAESTTLTCEGCGCMSADLEEHELCGECGMMRTEMQEGMGHSPWQPPTDPKKTWTDAKTGETSGYCPTCIGRGRVPNNRNGLSTCYRCKGQKIITMKPKVSEGELDQKAPPGREKQVKALKKDKDIDNPWAVAWASYSRSHKK